MEAGWLTKLQRVPVSPLVQNALVGQQGQPFASSLDHFICLGTADRSSSRLMIRSISTYGRLLIRQQGSSLIWAVRQEPMQILAVPNT
jgi:hypothetical protein